MRVVLLILLPLSQAFVAINSTAPECEEGWYNFGDSCYKVLNQNGIQYDNIKYCRSDCSYAGGNLGSIHSAEENTFVFDLLENHWQNTFLGAHWYTSVTFRWEDGTPWDYTNWAPNQPDGRKCVTIRDETWATDNCSWTGYWNCLCKKPAAK